MNATDFILSLVDAFDGHVEGRTLLQKRAYFVSLLAGIDSDLGFGAHYYGPYSTIVDNSVSRLKSLGFLNEENIGFGVASSGFEIKRYDYRLTDDGVRVTAALKQSPEYRGIADACHAILTAGNPNYLTLSIAAKAYFILKKRRQGMSADDIVREAQKFNWNIDKTSLDNAVQFLERLNLVQRGKPEN